MNYAEVQKEVNDLYKHYRNNSFNNSLYSKIMNIIAEFEAYYQERIELLNEKIKSTKAVLHDYEEIVSQKDEYIKELESTIKAKDYTIRTYEQLDREYNSKIEELEAKIKRLMESL